MRQSRNALFALATSATAASLADVCTVSHVKSILPSDGTLLGIDLIPSAVTASVYNANSSSSSSSSSSGGMGMGGGGATEYNYCNVTVSYAHTGRDDKVVLKVAFPSPSEFKNRFYVGGGGGYSLNADATGGLEYVRSRPSQMPDMMRSIMTTTRSSCTATVVSTGMRRTCSGTRLWAR